MTEVPKIDSWDGERAMVLVDGREVWSSAFGWETQGAQHCGSQNGGWHEVSHDVGPLLVSHYEDILTLRVTTTLDQGAGDESFGIANVAVGTGPQCGHGSCAARGGSSYECECEDGWGGADCSEGVLTVCGGFIAESFTAARPSSAAG